MVDFSIDGKLQAKLDWTKDFIENQVRPLEYICDYDFEGPVVLTNAPLRKITVHLQNVVKSQGQLAAPLLRHLGRNGFGEVKLTYMNEMPCLSAFGSVLFARSIT